MTTARLNIRLLLRGGLGALALGVALLLLHSWQMGRHASGQMARVDAAEAAGEPESAVAELGRYLRFAPGDREARVRHALLLANQARSPREQWQAVQALRQAARQSDQPEVHEALARLALQRNDPAEALRSLAPLLKVTPSRAEWWRLQAQAEQAAGRPLAAGEALERATALAPDRVDLAVQLASLYQVQLGQSARAEAALSRLVRDNSTRAEARLARAQFRIAQGRLARAEDDLAEARRLAPRDTNVLAVSATLAERRGLLADAAAHWRRVTDVSPDDAAGRDRLASVEQRRGRRREAEAVLREGLRRKPEDPQLLSALAEVCLADNRIEQAKGLCDRLPKEAAGPRAYLTGLVAERRGQPLEAANQLVAASRQGGLTGERVGRLMLALGRCYAALGAPDEQLRVTAYAAEVMPGPEARVELGRALLATGRADDALEVLRGVATLPVPPEAVWPLLARALVIEQGGRPGPRRNWAEVELALDRAGTDVALLRAEVLVLRDDLAGARRLLEQAVEASPEDVSLWRARVALAVREGGWVEALAAADKRLGNNPNWLLARVRLLAEQGGARAGRMLLAMEATVARLQGTERDRLEVALAEAQRQQGDWKAVERLCTGRLRREPSDLAARALLVEGLIERRDDTGAEALIDQMRKLEGPEGTAWRCARAAWALDRARRGRITELTEARTLVTQAHHRRPAWSVPVGLLARIADAEGRVEEAIANYRLVLKLGDFRSATLWRLVQLLSARGKYAELDADLSKAQRAGALRGDLLRAAAEIALRAHKPDRAAELAHQAVPAGAAYRERVWLGGLLGRAGRETEAIEVLEEAQQLAPGGVEGWLALAALYERRGGERGLEEALSQITRQVHEERRAVTLARAYESLGRFDDAARTYREELARRPFDADALAGQAALMLRLNDSPGAANALSRLLDARAGAREREQLEYRRLLALAWSAPGQPAARREEALQLLARNAPGSEADRRVSALVRGALRELAQLPRGPWTTAAERLRWAQLLDADGQWPRAREEYLALIGQDRKSPAYLVELIDGLLRHGKKVEAVTRLSELERLAPRHPRLAELQAKAERKSK